MPLAPEGGGEENRDEVSPSSDSVVSSPSGVYSGEPQPKAADDSKVFSSAS